MLHVYRYINSRKCNEAQMITETKLACVHTVCISKLANVWSILLYSKDIVHSEFWSVREPWKSENSLTSQTHCALMQYIWFFKAYIFLLFFILQNCLVNDWHCERTVDIGDKIVCMSWLGTSAKVH